VATIKDFLSLHLRVLIVSLSRWLIRLVAGKLYFFYWLGFMLEYDKDNNKDNDLSYVTNVSSTSALLFSYLILSMGHVYCLCLIDT
jgi:hypothetical protein